MFPTGAVGIIAEQYATALRTFSDVADQEFEGLSVAARLARKAGLLGNDRTIANKWVRRMERLDAAFHVNTHASEVKGRRMIVGLQELLCSPLEKKRQCPDSPDTSIGVGTAAALSGPDSPDTPIGVGTVTETVTHVGATDAEMPDARPSGIHVGCGNNVAEEFAVHNSNSHLEKIDTQKVVVAEPKPTPVPKSVPCRQAETPRGSKYDDAENCHVAYLPIMLHQVQVLVDEGGNMYRADNSMLRSSAPTLGLRKTTNVDDKDGTAGIPWGRRLYGSPVVGSDGAKWVRFMLPKSKSKEGF